MNTNQPHPDTLAPTALLDSAHPAIQAFVQTHALGSTDRERAVALYYAVRDGFRYDPYRIDLSSAGMTASAVLAAGLGPFAGTLALSLHTSGVLGRLFAESIENATPGPAFALRTRGVGELRIFAYATLPQVLSQLLSYTLYRWENNIRTAAVLGVVGVVGAGGLGQMLAFHMGLYQMRGLADHAGSGRPGGRLELLDT